MLAALMCLKSSISNFCSKSRCYLCQRLTTSVFFPELLENENLSDSAFDWLKVLKVHMTVGSTLREKPKKTMSPVDEHAEGATETPDSQPNPQLEVKTESANLGQCCHVTQYLIYGYNTDWITNICFVICYAKFPKSPSW